MIFEVAINNWEKHQNRRKDQKTYTWFKFHNDFFKDAVIAELDADEQISFIYLMCMCSQSYNFDTTSFKLSCNLMAKTLNKRQSSVIKVLRKLERCELITLRERYADVPLNKNRIYKNTRVQESSATPRAPVQKLWDEYRKICAVRLAGKEICSAKLKERLSHFWHKHPEWDDWIEMFKKMAASDFHWGANKFKKTYALNWVLKTEDNFTKTWNGEYCNNSAKPLKPEVRDDYLPPPEDYQF